MRAGRIEEANALAQRIGKAIANRNRARLSHVNTKTHAKDMWAAVRQLTGRRQNCYPVEGITADSMNQYYAGISSDADYHPPHCKLTANSGCIDLMLSQNGKFLISFDKLPSTATAIYSVCAPFWLPFVLLVSSVVMVPCTDFQRVFGSILRQRDAYWPASLSVSPAAVGT